MLLILKGICFAVLWFFAVGPAFWFGVVLPFRVWWLNPRPPASNLDDLGEYDRWRHRADMTDDEHEAALRAAWDDRQLPH